MTSAIRSPLDVILGIDPRSNIDRYCNVGVLQDVVPAASASLSDAAKG